MSTCSSIILIYSYEYIYVIIKARKGVSAKRKAQEDIKTDNSKQAKEA